LQQSDVFAQHLAFFAQQFFTAAKLTDPSPSKATTASINNFFI
jgi:hypothetical protein